jgi:hypothetical protein
MVPSTSVLPELAERILIEHKAVEAAARSALEHAHAAGVMLIQAKDAVGHGHFGAWLAENFERGDGTRLSARTAQAYMRVAKRWAELEAKAQSTADLSLNDALQLLAEPKPQATALPDKLADLRERFKQAETVGDYAAVAHDALKVQNEAAESKLRAERAIGQILNEASGCEAKVLSLVAKHPDGDFTSVIDERIAELEAGNGQTKHVMPRARAAPRRLRWPPEEMAELCRNWWDIQAAYVVLLDAAGDDAESIALSLGIDPADVQKVLYPAPANRADEFPFTAVPRSLPWYQATVENLIACQFRTAYANAAHHAHHEGLSELAPALEALDRQAWRRYHAMPRHDALLGTWYGADERAMPDTLASYLRGTVFNYAGGAANPPPIDVWLCHCAIADFRVALGIEPDAGRSFFDTFTSFMDAFLRGAGDSQAQGREIR